MINKIKTRSGWSLALIRKMVIDLKTVDYNTTHVISHCFLSNTLKQTVYGESDTLVNSVL